MLFPVAWLTLERSRAFDRAVAPPGCQNGSSCSRLQWQDSQQRLFSDGRFAEPCSRVSGYYSSAASATMRAKRSTSGTDRPGPWRMAMPSLPSRLISRATASRWVLMRLAISA